ncbi:MAG: hypothetical protein ACERLM_03000, partial [Acidimicrobiales bacterium]
VHFRPVEKWLLQLGFSYDTSPVDSDDRTPDMPIDRQIRYATGAQYIAGSLRLDRIPFRFLHIRNLQPVGIRDLYAGAG